MFDWILNRVVFLSWAGNVWEVKTQSRSRTGRKVPQKILELELAPGSPRQDKTRQLRELLTYNNKPSSYLQTWHNKSLSESSKVS